MTDLLISVECGERTCKPCRQRVPEYADEMGQAHVYQGVACRLFGKYLGLENDDTKPLVRCLACLAAERKAKGRER